MYRIWFVDEYMSCSKEVREVLLRIKYKGKIPMWVKIKLSIEDTIKSLLGRIYRIRKG